MCRYSLFLQKLENMIGHTVIDSTLSYDRALLFPVESSCIILVIYDNNIRILCCKYLLCFSFVKLFHFFHFGFLAFRKVLVNNLYCGVYTTSCHKSTRLMTETFQ